MFEAATYIVCYLIVTLGWCAGGWIVSRVICHEEGE